MLLWVDAQDVTWSWLGSAAASLGMAEPVNPAPGQNNLCTSASVFPGCLGLLSGGFGGQLLLSWVFLGFVVWFGFFFPPCCSDCHLDRVRKPFIKE